MSSEPGPPPGIGTPQAQHPSFAPPPGIGTPQAQHPSFAPPPGQPVPAPPGPERVRQGPDPAWAPPHPLTRVAAAPPTGRRPAHPHRARRAVVASVLVGGLLLVGALSSLPVLPSATPRPGVQPSLVTASPSAAATGTTTVTGGGVGTAVAFTASAGSGTITVTSATWDDGGALAPPEGQRYLVLDVEVECSQGEVDLSPVLLLLSSGAAKELPGFGATIDRPLAGSVLAARQRASGQVAYALVPGAATLHLLDEDLRRLAAIEIPAP